MSAPTSQGSAGPLALDTGATLRLDGASGAWSVRSGALALFRASVLHGDLLGPRRYCFGVDAGEALWALPAVAGAPAVLAVAMEPTQLDPLDAIRADETRVSTWQQAWERALPGEPASDTPRSLAAFHAALAARLIAMEARQCDEERQRASRREARDAAIAADSLGRLAAVLGARREVPFGAVDDFAAARIVAEAQGIVLTRPIAETEHGGEPLDAVARNSRVRSRTVRLSAEWWTRSAGPLVGRLAVDGRAVALLPRRRGGYALIDPALGRPVRVDAATAAGLAPQAIQFYRPLPERIDSPLDLLRFALVGRGRDLRTIGATAAVATLLGMIAPQAMALLVDHVVPDSDRGLLAQLGLGLVAAALGAGVFRLAQGVAMLRLESGANAVTQAAVWDRLLRLQPAFFRRFSTGDLHGRVGAIDRIRAMVGGSTLRSLFSAVLLLLNLGLLVFYSPRLTLIGVGVAAATAVVTLVGGRALVRGERSVLELQGHYFSRIVQLVQGVAKLRVAAAEERAFARWAGDHARLVGLELRQRRLRDAMQLTNAAIAAAGTLLLLGTAAGLVHSAATSALTAGAFLGFHVAYGTFIAAVLGLSQTWTELLVVGLLRERARPILEEPPEVRAAKTDPGTLRGDLELRGVSFRYRADGPPILDQVDLLAGAGEFIAVVGPSGGGKSTLLRLMLGFESPQEGVVLFDGQDLAGLDVHAVRRQLGVVLQSGRIGAGSIFDNIVCGAGMTLNEAMEAACAAGFAEDLQALPMGLHTVVSEGGTNLSGGQRQRLLLARALVHRPRLLILDEATSALDQHTQAIVSAGLDKMKVTRLVVAHRLSTVRRADRIYVLEGGRIVERGPYDELAKADGPFSRLVARQTA